MPYLDNAMNRINRSGRSRGIGQRDGLSKADVDLMATVAPQRRKFRNGIRGAALFRTMFNACLRASEAVNIHVEHLHFNQDGTGTLAVPFAKSDEFGEGSTRFLGADTVEALRHWIETARIESGKVLLNCGGKGHGYPMSVQACRDAIKSLAKLAGIEGKIGSHSLRIGMAQELVRKGATIAEVQQVGGWRPPAQVAH